MNHGEYMASREWGLLKQAVIDRNDGRCERCRFYRVEHVHHLTYERFGYELLSDLLHVCGKCHAYLHGISDLDPTNCTEWARKPGRVVICGIEFYNDTGERLNKMVSMKQIIDLLAAAVAGD